ncbi:hypothetical protein DEM34_18785 [Spiribacter halobius]|uniref:Uncharacterized protein n=1 Tax=Sediminicurvatus halobius TaxID=2182432 RepID=A0A2U2MVT7_9GAMM|nr:hypothetical protein DEM34_18785 [Spiribacter halobius]
MFESFQTFNEIRNLLIGELLIGFLDMLRDKLLKLFSEFSNSIRTCTRSSDFPREVFNPVIHAVRNLSET